MKVALFMQPILGDVDSGERRPSGLVLARRATIAEEGERGTCLAPLL